MSTTPNELARFAERLRDTGERILVNTGFMVTDHSAVAFGALLVNSAAELERLSRQNAELLEAAERLLEEIKYPTSERLFLRLADNLRAATSKLNKD